MSINQIEQDRIAQTVRESLTVGDPAGLLDKVAVRREVARELAREGHVMAPQTWARTVRDIVRIITDPAIIDQIIGLITDEHTFNLHAEALARAAERFYPEVSE